MLDFDKIFDSAGSVRKIAQSYRDGKSVSAFGLGEFAKAAVTAECAAGVGGTTLAVAGDFYLARALYDKLKPLVRAIALLPSRDDALVYRDALAGENVLTRLRTLSGILSGEYDVVVCSAEALLQPFPDPELYKSNILCIERGKSYDMEEVVALLVRSGYVREPQLSDVGRFSRRGDILDIWSVGETSPARIEFFGDEVESIRYFDAQIQVSDTAADRYRICPATEFLCVDQAAEVVATRLEREAVDAAAKLAPDAAIKVKARAGDLSERVRSGDRSRNLGYLLPLVPTVSLYEFGGFSGAVYSEVKQIVDNASLLVSEHRGRFATLIERGETLPFCYDGLYGADKLSDFSGRKLAFHAVTTANRVFQPQAVFTVKTTELGDYHRDYLTLSADIKTWTSRGYSVALCVPDDGLKDTMSGFLSEQNVPYSFGYGDGVRLVREYAEGGCAFHEEKRVVVGTTLLARKPPKKQIKRAKSDAFMSVAPGDYVVHDLHGVGKFDGVVKLEVGGVRRDYLLVLYAGEDKLYVPVENMDSLSKYSSGGSPTLSKIGGADFSRAKERAKKAIKELAINLVELYGERLDGKGYVYSDDDSLLHEFEKGFEFTETEDQLTAIEEGLADLKSGKIMDRLLCGDVGYGKTEVALRLAFKVIIEGKQVAFLSPTTVLAKQHFETVKRRMEPFGVTMARLTRFDGKAEQQSAIEGLRVGRVDIVVGTHRLLSKDVDFADLGLLILDEEQRFGVADKEKIKDLRRGVNVLTLSATPIPRTLHMSLSGIRDISVLDTPPTQRIPIQTYVIEYGETLVADALMRELNRGGQAFVVYNRVSDIDRFTARLSAILPEAKIAYAHGQMREETLERTIEAFVEGRTDVLVSSTIIENGIDIARANTMIVVDSDKLGLAQLYQLRGRVGRSDRLAYVFFTFDGRKTLTDAAYQRLEAITQFTEFGSGFRIAMRDLEIRGAGAVLGAQQHGHIERIGYDAYRRLLEQAMGELRGEKHAERSEVKISTDYALFVPEGYITDREWRLRIYSRIARVDSIAARERLISDLGDVYGAVPDSVKNLIDVALIKNLAGEIGAQKVTINRRESELSFAKIKDIAPAVHSTAEEYEGRLNAPTASIKFPSHSRLLKFLMNCKKLNK